MEISPKANDKPSRRHADTFLSDAVHPRPSRRLGYGDGFRFGIGFMLANLTLGLVIGGLAWVLIITLHIR